LSAGLRAGVWRILPGSQASAVEAARLGLSGLCCAAGLAAASASECPAEASGHRAACSTAGHGSCCAAGADASEATETQHKQQPEQHRDTDEARTVHHASILTRLKSGAGRDDDHLMDQTLDTTVRLAPAAAARARRPLVTAGNLAPAAALMCVALGAFTLPLGIGPNRRGYGLSLGYSLMVQYGLVDALLLVALVVGVVPTARRLLRRRTTVLVTAGALLVAGLAVSFVFHPIDRGAFIVLRLAAAVVVADVLSQDRSDVTRPVGGILTGLALFEWGLGVFQLTTHGALGVWFLGERRHPLYRFGNVLAPAGTFFHGYLLSGFVSMAMGVTCAFALAGRLRVRWAAAVAFAAGSTAMLTVARVGVAGLVLMTLCLLLAGVFGSRSVRRGAVCMVVAVWLGVAVTYPIDHGGWAEKREMAKSIGGDVSNGRIGLLRENLDVFRRHPFVGVGVGRYMTTLIDEGRMTDPVPKPPHMVLMSALSEGGLLAVPALLLHVFGVVMLVWRRRFVALVAYVGVLAPLMLDQYMWNWPEGMMMVAIAFGIAAIPGLDGPRRATAAVLSAV
jgi:hypothetical protein